MPSRRRSRHPLLRFIADRRLWLGGLLFVLSLLSAVLHYVSWLTAVVVGIVLAFVVIVIGEWVHLQLSMERWLRKLAQGDSDEHADRAVG